MEVVVVSEGVIVPVEIDVTDGVLAFEINGLEGVVDIVARCN